MTAHKECRAVGALWGAPDNCGCSACADLRDLDSAISEAEADPGTPHGEGRWSAMWLPGAADTHVLCIPQRSHAPVSRDSDRYLGHLPTDVLQGLRQLFGGPPA